MGAFFDALKAGMTASEERTEPREYAIAGRAVRCPHCGETTFAPGRALLNTPGLTFIGLDWAESSATILVCAECGRIEWYAVDLRGMNDQRPAGR